MDRIVIAVLGMDKVGIVAKFCTYFAENKMNIVEMAQTTISKVFNMVIIVDISPSDKEFDRIFEDMKIISKEIECIVTTVKYEELKSLTEA